MRTPFVILLSSVAIAIAIATVGCEKHKEAPPPPSTEPAAAEPTASPSAPSQAKFDESQLNPFQPLPEALDKPVIDEPVKLGQTLWFDVRLSKNKDVSCNSCHDLAKGGVDGEAISSGTGKQKGKRNTPTVLNAAGAFAQGWDARASTMEELVVPHVLDESIMGMADEKRLVDAVAAIPAYAAAFKKAFPEEKTPVTADTLSRALGGFVKKLFARSRWDKYLAGDKSALTEDELTGFATFVGAGCPTCHQGKYLGGTNAQKLGIAKPWPPPAGAEPGRFEVTKQEADRGLFKVPTLRNVTRTAPYLHDGSIATLDETTRLMSRHQVGKELTDAQIKAIVGFLGTLVGDAPKELTSKPGATPAPKASKPD